jgi:hypothetical protein
MVWSAAKAVRQQYVKGLETQEKAVKEKLCPVLSKLLDGDKLKARRIEAVVKLAQDKGIDKLFPEEFEKLTIKAKDKLEKRSIFTKVLDKVNKVVDTVKKKFTSKDVEYDKVRDAVKVTTPEKILETAEGLERELGKVERYSAQYAYTMGKYPVDKLQPQDKKFIVGLRSELPILPARPQTTHQSVDKVRTGLKAAQDKAPSVSPDVARSPVQGKAERRR